MGKKESKIKSWFKDLFSDPMRERLRVLRVRFNEWRFPQRMVSHTYYGYNLNLLIADPVAALWYDQDWIESKEYRYLRTRKLKEGARIFHIGAHQCIEGIVFAKIVGEKGQVIALESNAHNVRVAKNNAHFNHAKQLMVIHAACSDKNGKIFVNEAFNGNVFDGNPLQGKVEVSAFTLDDLTKAYGRPDLVIIDVKGYEVQVLRGAKETFRIPPDFYIRVNSFEDIARYGGTISELMSLFPAGKYDFLAEIQPDSPTDFSSFLPVDEKVLSTHKPFPLLAIAKKLEKKVSARKT